MTTQRAQHGLGMSDMDLWQMAHNSFTSAFLPEDLRNRYLQEIERHRPSGTGVIPTSFE